MPANRVTDYDAEKILDTLVEGKKFFLQTELDIDFQTRLLNHLNVTKSRIKKLTDAFGVDNDVNMVIRIRPDSFTPEDQLAKTIQSPISGYLIWGEEPVEKRKKFQGFVIE